MKYGTQKEKQSEVAPFDFPREVCFKENKLKLYPWLRILTIGVLCAPVLQMKAFSSEGARNDFNQVFTAKPIHEVHGNYTPLFRWCGEDAFVVDWRGAGNHSIEWVSLATKGRKELFSQTGLGKIRGKSELMNCSADGKWIVLSDWSSSRIDKTWKSSGEHDTAWEGQVPYLVRYEVETGAIQRFAGVRFDLRGPVMSPVGNRVFLGVRHKVQTKMPSPRWDEIWINKEVIGSTSFFSWFLDGTGIVLETEDGVLVKKHGSDGFEKLYRDIPPKQLTTLKAGLDSQFFYAGRDKKRIPRENFVFEKLFRCRILKNSRVNCSEVVEVGTISPGEFSYTVSSKGDLFFTKSNKGSGETCIHRTLPGDGKSVCVVKVNVPNMAKLYLEDTSFGGSKLVYSLAYQKKSDENCKDQFCGMDFVRRVYYLSDLGSH